jgi:hypothetical protein
VTQILINPSLSRRVLLQDRLKRHGLYYATKCIEKQGPPVLVINSFWRSGSTLLLEFLADLFKMRPYFEPLTPREPTFNSVYQRLDVLKVNLERLHPVDSDGQVLHLINTGSFHSKWVYQCQSAQNFTAQNGKLMKLVTGAHIVPQMLVQGTPVVHLSRDVFKVAESFLNSKWTNRFFDGIDLSYLINETQSEVAAFYSPFANFLDLRKFTLVEQVAIYHTITERYVRTLAPSAIFVNYEDFLEKPYELVNELSQLLNLAFDGSKINSLLSRPSRMSVHNTNKRKLTKSEKETITQIIERIQSVCQH